MGCSAGEIEKMKFCNYALPYLNPNACKYCSNNQDYDVTYYPMVTTTRFEIVDTGKIQPVAKKKVTEKFDADGKLIERVTEEV